MSVILLTADPEELARIIRALETHADYCRTLVGRRSLGGEHNKDRRAGLRAEARASDDLAARYIRAQQQGGA